MFFPCLKTLFLFVTLTLCPSPLRKWTALSHVCGGEFQDMQMKPVGRNIAGASLLCSTV